MTRDTRRIACSMNHGSTFSASVCDFRGSLSVVINAVKVVDLTTLREI